jgi:nucleoside-triphosphatase THEP1
MNQQIYIFSRPVGSGKTTALQEWLLQTPDVHGIITPLLEGKRVLHLLEQNITLDFETDADDKEPTIAVGRFHFLQLAFEAAQLVMQHARTDAAPWFIVDEAGKLETEQHSGFEPALSTLIKKYQQPGTPGKLLLVIRDTLLDKAIAKYQLQGAHLLNKLPYE